MDAPNIQQVLMTLIDYFETGNAETDAAAKAVLATDSKYDEYWLPEIEKFQKSVEWTGLRGPEAELLACGLRKAAGLIAAKKQT